MRKLKKAIRLIALGLLWLPTFGANAATNYQGLWWNPAESGWGINFSHQGDIIFATWFTYDTAGKPWWLIAQLDKKSEGVYSGSVATVSGPPFDSEPFPPGGSPGGAVETSVGSMTATFADATHGTINYTVNGKTQTKAIVPQAFGPLPTCVWSAQTRLADATNYTDLWWNPAESGWGVNFTHQGDVVFATWFTYDRARKPWWLIAQLDKKSDGFYSGAVAKVAGPRFDAEPFPPSGSPGGAVETAVGTATVTFTNGNSAIFNYTVDDIAQTKKIERQVFAAPGTVCSPPPGPSPTAVGAPVDTAITKTIGPSGGSLATADGRFALTIPAGALAANTEISIQPISNFAHGKVGPAYRLTPDGQTFAKPVTLKFTYADADLKGTAPEFLGTAFQRADGYWQWLGKPTLDTAAKTVSVASNHFTDFSFVAFLQLLPAKQTVKTKKNKVTLRVAPCYDPDAELAKLLGAPCDSSENLPLVSGITVGDWSVNGQPGGSAVLGTVTGVDDYAMYSSPDSQPQPNKVAVSARVTKGSASGLVVSNITVVGDMWTGWVSQTQLGLVGSARITWILNSVWENNIAQYDAEGTSTSPGDDTCTVSPMNHEFQPGPGKWMLIDNNANPPTYEAFFGDYWDTLETCPPSGTPPRYETYPSNTVVFGFGGNTDLGSYKGVITEDGTKFEGSNRWESSETSFQWSFTREP